jgi:hypothetical protein
LPQILSEIGMSQRWYSAWATSVVINGSRNMAVFFASFLKVASAASNLESKKSTGLKKYVTMYCTTMINEYDDDLRGGDDDGSSLIAVSSRFQACSNLWICDLGHVRPARRNI